MSTFYIAFLVSESTWFTDLVPNYRQPNNRVSSALNALCIPFIFRDLNLHTDIPTSFDEFYDRIIKRHANSIHTIRVSLEGILLTDFRFSRILKASRNATTLMLYHPNFQITPPFWNSHVDYDNPNCLTETNRAIVASLANGSLNSLGIYSHYIT